MVYPALDDLKLNITFKDIDLAGNPVIVNIEAAPDNPPTLRASFEYVLEIYVASVYGGSDFLLAATKYAREIPPFSDESGITYYPGADFDISDVLRSAITPQQPSITLPSLALDVLMTNETSHLVEYYLIKKVVGASVPDVQTPIRTAIISRLSKKKWPTWKDFFFKSEYQMSGVVDEESPLGPKFLTWAPRRRTILTNEPVFLSYLNNGGSKLVVAIGYNVRLSDLHLAASPNLMGSNAQLKAESTSVITSRVGYHFQKLSASDSTTDPYARLFYYLHSQFDGLRISEVMVYDIDRTPQTYPARFIVFRNTLGGYDTLACKGRTSISTQVAADMSQQVSPPLSPKAEEIYAEAKEGTVTYTLNTGYLKEYPNNYLLELLYSTEVYLYTADGLLPVVLVTDTLIDVEKQFLRSETINLRLANTEVAGDFLGTAPTSATRTKYWAGVQPYCQIDSFGKRNGKMAFAKLEYRYLDGSGTEKVPGVGLKFNLESDVDYIAPLTSTECAVGTTPFTNASQTRTLKFKNATCGVGLEGLPIVITVTAGTYGGNTLAEANQRAQAYIDSIDNQTYADTSGTCTAAPWTYSSPGGIPTGHFNCRFVQEVFKPENGIAGGPGVSSGDPTQLFYGSMWYCGISTNPSSIYYPSTIGDMTFPISAGAGYHVDLYSTVQKVIRVYRNGTLIQTTTISAGTFTGAGNFARTSITGSGSWSNGDLIYISVKLT